MRSLNAWDALMDLIYQSQAQKVSSGSTETGKGLQHCAAGAVDPDRPFINVNLGWPGRVNDGRVFFNSSLSRFLEEKCSQMNYRLVPTGNGTYTPIPLYLLGDSAYGNSKRMVTTYEIGECERDHIVQKLNKRLAGVRYVVEHAFSLLKGRFRILLSSMPMAKRSVEKATNIVMACVVLHNFLIDQN